MRKLSLAFSFLLVLALLTGCASLDVILRDSPASLNQILAQTPALVADATSDDPYFSLSVDSETALRVSRDYSRSTEDIVLQTPLKPFTDAGLNVAALDAGLRADGASLYFAADFGAGTGERTTFTDALFERVSADRAALSFHAALDHFGIQFPAGKFEWAKDESSNDKDIVFVLFAQPLEALGVDVHNIEGWVFMTMQDDAGNDLDVLLKPYSLES